MNDQLIMLVCITGTVALVAYFIGQFILTRGQEGRLRNRLKDGGRDVRRASASGNTRFKDLVQNLGQKAAKPFMSQDANKQGIIKQNLARAGIYSPTAVRAVTGAKVIFAVAGLVLGYLSGVYLEQPPFNVKTLELLFEAEATMPFFASDVDWGAIRTFRVNL